MVADDTNKVAPPLTWLVAPAWQSLAALAFLAIPALFLCAWFRPLNPKYPAPGWAALVCLGIAMLLLRKLLLGGCIVDYKRECFVRWWGPLFPIARWTIPFANIAAVHVGYGLWPNSVRVASGKRESFHLAIETSGVQYVIKHELRDPQVALDIARDLAHDLDTRLVNHLQHDTLSKSTDRSRD
jgi:hypothetical protein